MKEPDNTGLFERTTMRPGYSKPQVQEKRVWWKHENKGGKEAQAGLSE